MDELDAVVVGAGVAGLYALHLLREQGLRVRCFDAADEPGGVWHHQRYPGARIDTEGYAYQYQFSEDLYRDWGWSERFPAGYEVLRWLRFAVDRLDLTRDLQPATPVVSARFDDDGWVVRTGDGGSVRARFLLCCTGVFGSPRRDAIPGRTDFAGPVVHTGAWPARGPDLAGKRVGVVGNGPSAVQLVPRAADAAGHLTLFARSPRWVLPAANPMYGWPEREAYRSRLSEVRQAIRNTFGGLERELSGVGPADVAALYAEDPLLLRPAALPGVLTDEELRAAVAGEVRERMCERLGGDPRLTKLLVPEDDDFGLRPVATDQGYLGAVARDDVDVVGVRDDPVTRIRPEGIELASGTVHALDVLVLATGFAQAGGCGVELRGRDGARFTTAGALGITAHGFPNLFVPSAVSRGHGNDAACLQGQVEWICEAIRRVRADGAATIEPTPAGVSAGDTAGTGVPDTGLPPPGGIGAYLRRCAEEARAGYPSFRRG